MLATLFSNSMATTGRDACSKFVRIDLQAFKAVAAEVSVAAVEVSLEVSLVVVASWEVGEGMVVVTVVVEVVSAADSVDNPEVVLMMAATPRPLPQMHSLTSLVRARTGARLSSFAM